MNKLKDVLKNKIAYIIIFVAVFLIITIPMYGENIITSDDYLFHFSRIDSLTKSIKVGTFPVKIHFDMANHSGYGTGFFYPNFFLYVPAVINLMLSNIGLTYKLFLGLVFFAIFISSYFSVKVVTKNNKIAFLSSMLLILSKGLMLNYYDRTAMGELIGFIFIMPIVCGLYNYIHDDFDKPWLLAIGFFGAANSHLITTFVCIIYAVIYFICNIKTTLKSPKKFFKLCVVAGIVTLLSTSFWLPMLEQLRYQTLKLSESWTSIKDDKFNILDLLGVGRYSIGLVITVFVPVIIYSIFDKKFENKYKAFSIATILLMFLMVFSPFWKLTNDYTNIIQFKWRLIGITTNLSCLIIPIILDNYLKDKKYNIAYFGIIIISMVLAIINIYGVVKAHDKYSSKYIETIIYEIPESIGGGQEYLPIEVDYDELLKRPYTVIGDEGSLMALSKENPKNIFYADLDRGYKVVEVPVIYYLGYVCNVTSPEGVVVPLPVEKSDNGFLKITFPDGAYGTVNIWYEGTKWQERAYLVSEVTAIFTLVTTCGFIVYKKFKNKK